MQKIPLRDEWASKQSVFRTFPDRQGFIAFRRVGNALEFLTEVARGNFFNHLKAVELMLLIPIMGMDNARPVRRFSGKEDHFTNLLFHDKYIYAGHGGVESSFHTDILHH